MWSFLKLCLISVFCSALWTPSFSVLATHTVCETIVYTTPTVATSTTATAQTLHWWRVRALTGFLCVSQVKAQALSMTMLTAILHLFHHRICQAHSDTVDVVNQRRHHPFRVQNANPEIRAQICRQQVSSNRTLSSLNARKETALHKCVGVQFLSLFVSSFTQPVLKEILCVLQPTRRSGVSALPAWWPAQWGEQGYSTATCRHRGLRPFIVSVCAFDFDSG